MNQFVPKFTGIVKGVLTGFDRIVFKGFLLPLMHAGGAKRFCEGKGILNKDFKSWMLEQTFRIVAFAEALAKESGGGIVALSSSHIRKEKIAHAHQKERDIQSGLIGVYCATESCLTYKAVFNKESGYPLLRREWGKCKHLYFYFDHAQYGFMNVRLQTWFPYHLQVCLNGREWLRRQLESENMDFLAEGNKFLHVGDYARAQQLLDSQLDARFEPLLDGFASAVFPARPEILGTRLSYYWTLWQSEWATDLVFPSPKDITPLMDSLLRHAFMTGTATRVLRYMDRPLRLDGAPHANNHDEVTSKLLDFHDGVRVRHWVGGNSVKCYNEHNVLRVETTVNNPAMFKAPRHVQGQSAQAPKRLLPLRKGVMDTPLRAKVSGQVNDRFLDNLAAARCETPVRELLDRVTIPIQRKKRRVRALDPSGKDRALLQAISDPEFCLSGIANKPLREKLKGKPGYDRTDKQLSAKISRQLRLLRDHGLIRKLGKQKKYAMTKKGHELTATLNALLAASAKQLMEMAA